MNRKILITLAAIFIAIFIAQGPILHTASPQKRTATKTSQPSAEAPQAKPPAIRASYPRLNLALIPGGFTSVEEFQQRIAKDPTLYLFFGRCGTQATMEPLREDILVFMAFRRGQEIKWTRRPLLVHKGEYVLNICGKTVLARCGNLITWAPQEPSEDITPSLLEVPVEELKPAEALAFSTQRDTPEAADIPMAAFPEPTSVPESVSKRHFFFVPPIYLASRDHSSSVYSPARRTAISGDEFSGNRYLFTLLLGLLAIVVLKLVTR